MKQDDLRRWAGKKTSLRSRAPEAAPGPQLPAPPHGYTYVVLQGVPVLMPIGAPPPAGAVVVAASPTRGAPSNVVPLRRGPSARLVRPLTSNGVQVPDPADAFLASLPDLAPGAAAQLGVPNTYNALTEELADAAALENGVSAPDNPWGRRALRTVTDDLQPGGPGGGDAA